MQILQVAAILESPHTTRKNTENMVVKGALQWTAMQANIPCALFFCILPQCKLTTGLNTDHIFGQCTKIDQFSKQIAENH